MGYKKAARRVEAFLRGGSTVRLARVCAFYSVVVLTTVSGQKCIAAEAREDVNLLVNNFVGADGEGNTVPGASVPFGFVSLSPDTTNAASSGYDSKGLILGFSHTHVSGTGGGSKYGNFRVTPTAGPVTVNNLAFHRFNEAAHPGFYAISLGNSPQSTIRASMTASRRVGFTRYIYPAGLQRNIVLDVASFIPLGGDAAAQHPLKAEVTILGEHDVSGWATFTGGWNPAPYTIYFFATFQQPMLQSGTWTASLSGSSLQTGKTHLEKAGFDVTRQERMGMFASFGDASGATVQMKLAVSMVSTDQAKANLDAEMPGWDFDRECAASAAAWRSILNLIYVEGGDADQRSLFYTALFRSHQMPHDLSGENVWWQSPEPHYEDFYTIWDTFRTLHPLFTLLEPERQRDMVRSLLDTYQHTGWLPDGRVAGANGLAQGGSNADVVIADAVVKRLPGIDYNLAYEAILKDGEQQSPDPLNVGRELRDYTKLGYMSLDETRSASRTLEYAYDDYAIAEVAELLGRHDDARKYFARSGNWKHLWNESSQCIRPRYADGKWLENFDCDREYPDHTTGWWDPPYYEGSARQYSTFIPQDIYGLIEKLGGKEEFVRWLDFLFDQKLYTQANEPDILAPYLYAHVGRHDRVCERVRSLLQTEYHNSRTGIPGNDDAGTMSSWYVWSAIGLYPNAGQPYYYIGSPLFTKSTIKTGQTHFVIEALNNSPQNIYVQHAKLNGKEIGRLWLSHEEVARGGVLTLYMGPKSSGWGHDGPPPPHMGISTNEQNSQGH